MSILFDKRPSVQATWTIIKKTPPDVDDDTAVLNRCLWDALTEHLNPSPPHLCISITPIQSVLNLQQSFVCWALLNEENDSEILEIPPAWPTIYQQIFGSGDILLKKVTPIALTVVIVTALSREAYLQASANHSDLGEWLSFGKRILRQGDVLSVPKKNPKLVDVALRYRLDMLEPVLQGYVENGMTKIVVALSQTDTLIHDSTMDIEGEQDAIEIDESFLGSSISNTCSTQNSPLDHPYKNEAMERSYPEFFYKSMLSPFKHVEDHYTLFFRTSDLGKIGILNGDWAIAGIVPSKYRLVRVLAKDILIDSAGYLIGSPLLLHNILSDGGDIGLQRPSSIYVRPSPFGSSNPPIPVARSVTIARVASPNSINRQYQSLFLHSLKKYFDAGRRLIKQNDIIAVSIDTDLTRWLELEGRTGDDDDDDHVDLIDFNHPSNGPRTNGLVFFKVTSIEYDVVSQSGPALQDLYTGSTLGELGCWIDTSITRMIQAGVEHARVPDVISYMQIDATSSTILRTLESLPVSHYLGPNSTFSQLMALSSAALCRRAVEYSLHLSFLLKGGRGIGKFTVVTWVSQRLGLNLQEINCYNLLGESDVKTEAMLRVKFEQASTCTPCFLVLRHLEALTQTTQSLEGKKDSPTVTTLRECIGGIQTSWKNTGYPLIVIGTTSTGNSLPVGLGSCFKQEISFEAPNEGERLEILRCLLSNVLIASDVSLQYLATQTAALLAGDLHDLVDRAKAASVDRAMNTACQTMKEDLSTLYSIPITVSDFDIALGKARDSYSESIGAPKIPNVTWDDVGGLAHVKSDILDTIQLPLDHPELFAEGLKKRSGILLYGPPGTGKTLIAKAVATSCSMNFFVVKGPELLDMYIGESEANVRRVFQRARDAKPCVIFFDELDSIAPKRGNHGDSGGVMDRIVSQLLAELDGMSGRKEAADVFVIGATNRPDLLDPALLRPGRFDRMSYLGISDSHEAQLDIMEALTRKFRLDPALDLRRIAQKCPLNLTGADFYALCSDAMLNAMSRKAEGIDTKISVFNSQPGHHRHPRPVTAEYYLTELASAEDMAVQVSQEDFDRALCSLVPSVSQAEMEHYAQMQRRFSHGAGSSES